MTFQEWWADKGQEEFAFSAEQWALAGWAAHRIHGTALDSPPLEENMLEDKKNEIQGPYG